MTRISPADVTVLIPAAGRVPEGLLALANIACPAMIPIGGRPVIHWTMSYLRSLGFRRYIIAVARSGMFVEDFVDSAFGQDCEIAFITPSHDGGVGRTVLELAAHATTPAALIVLGDTHFQFPDSPEVTDLDRPFVLAHQVEDSYRWCIAETTHDGELVRLRDKVPDLDGELAALIGVYYFADREALQRAATATVLDAEERRKPAQLAGILERVHAETPLRVLFAPTWLDCGNADMQARSHQTLLQSRAFNELSIDATLGTITKRSKAVDKFINEINFLRLLPADLAVLFPRVLAYSTEWSAPWVQTEYYGYPNLADVFLFENLDPGIWERVFAHLAAIVSNEFARHARPLPPGAVRDMYITKTKHRLATMAAPPALRALVDTDGPITVNGVAIANWVALWPRIEAAVDELAVNARGTVVHGDLCLSNILYDLRSRICKLIDPRGSFGEVGIYGDPRYDVAKLWHSVHGLYDFIANDLFRVRIEGTNIELSIRGTNHQREIEARFVKGFFGDGDFAAKEIQLITALLFASMPALHAEKPQRQIAMYARSLQLVHEYLA